jgi:hypothetical protein
MGSKHHRQVKRLVELLNEVQSDAPHRSGSVERLSEAIRNPARPRSTSEALALRGDLMVIDMSAIRDDTFPLPIEVPERQRWFLIPRRITARTPDAAVSKIVADLENRSPIRRRQAANYLASWPKSPEVDEALVHATTMDDDGWVNAFAAMSLVVHGYRETNVLCRTAMTAVARDRDADIVGALLLAVAISAAWDGSSASRRKAAECIEAARMRPEYVNVADEVLAAFRGRPGAVVHPTDE